MAQLKFAKKYSKPSSNSTSTSTTSNTKSLSCLYLSLACSIGSFSLACGSLLQLQSTSEKLSVQRGLFLTTLGFLHFISLTDFCNKYLLETKNGTFIRNKYHLMISDVMDITNKIVSAVQAAFSFLAGLIACKGTCSKSFLYASHYVLEAYAWFGTAYFLYDIWSMYKIHTQTIADKLLKLTNSKISNVYKNGYLVDELHTEQNDNDNTLKDSANTSQKWNFLRYIITHPMMIIHHVFIGTFGWLVIVYIRGAGDCVYSFMFMMEFSTPFVSLRGILSILKLKDSKLYIYNGFAMLISFFICRILMWPYVFYWYSVVINKSIIQAILGLPRGCKISIMILLTLQVYWFYLMVKGAIKVLLPKSKKNNVTSHKSQNNNLSPEIPNNSILNSIDATKSSHIQ